jgi:hypothetical protein
LSSTIVRGNSYLEVLDIATPANITDFYTNLGLIDTRYKNLVQTRIWTNDILGFPAIDGYTGFQIGDDTQGTQIILADIDTKKNAITNNNGSLKFWNDAFDPAALASSWGYMLEMTRFGINRFYTNSYQYIPFDMPILTIDDKTFLTSPCIPQSDLTQFVTPVVRSGGTNIYDITIKCSGCNPYNRTVTVSVQYALNFTQTAVSGATFPTTTATQTLSIGSQSATINGSAFTGYTFASTGTATAYSYTQSAISVWNIFQPVGQLTWVITPTDTQNEIDTYVLTIDLNRTENTLTGVTRTARTGNLDGSFITLKGTAITATTTRTSGTGTLTTTATPTNTLLTTTRSGNDNLKVDYFNTEVSASTVQTTSSFTGSTLYPLYTDNYLASTSAGRNVITSTATPISYDAGTGIVTISTAFASYGFNTVLNQNFNNLLGEETFLNVFSTIYRYYDVTVYVDDALNQNTNFVIDFATNTGTRLSASWRTDSGYQNGTAWVNVTTSTSSCIISSLPNYAGAQIEFTLLNPYVSGRRKGVKAHNHGYLTATDECNYFTTGVNTNTSLTYPSLFVKAGASTQPLNGTITIIGRN